MCTTKRSFRSFQIFDDVFITENFRVTYMIVYDFNYPGFSLVYLLYLRYDFFKLSVIVTYDGQKILIVSYV